MSKLKRWTPHSIVAALHERGMTLSALAELNGLNPSTFRTVSSRTNRRAERIISDFLDVPVNELFPDRYPIRKSRILSSKYEAALESQKSSPVFDRTAA